MTPGELKEFLDVLPKNVRKLVIDPQGATMVEFGPAEPAPAEPVQVMQLPDGRLVPIAPTEADLNPKEPMDPRLEHILETFPQMKEWLDKEAAK